MEKYILGQEVNAVKNGDSITGTITEVLPEMEYEITDALGNIRIVDHGNIINAI